MLKKLRFQFICFTMTVVTVLLSVVFGLVYHSTRMNLEQQSLQLMNRLRNDIHRPGPGQDEGDQVQLPYFILRVDAAGSIRAIGNGYFDLSDRETMVALAQAAMDAPEQMGVLEDQCLRYSRYETPVGISIIFTDISSEKALLRELIADCVFIGLLCLLVFLGLSFLLAWWGTKPVEEAWTQQKQFVADASHELKTPLTVILTNAELLQTPQLSPESQNQFAENILTMSHQMRGLVESLLDLARVDNGTLKTHFAPLDLSALVQETILPFEPLYFEQGIELHLRVEDCLWVQGSGNHLRQVLEILLDNARKYTYAHGWVEVRLIRQGSHCLLSVSDPGEPITKEDLENIFKRFYRVSKARSMNHSYGLGLPIALRIVQAHGGKIWAESNGGVNTFRVQLPCLPPRRNQEQHNLEA